MLIFRAGFVPIMASTHGILNIAIPTKPEIISLHDVINTLLSIVSEKRRGM